MQSFSWMPCLLKQVLPYRTFHIKIQPLILHRLRHLSHMAAVQSREIRIPTPYGHLAAQEWGPEDGIPVLALHGWLDNSGTFEKLIPLLSSQLHVIAVDEPGLGHSSRAPTGAIIHHWDYLFDIKRVLDYLKWDKTILLGHSRGGAACLLFASLFPKHVEKVIVLDAIRPIAVPTEYLVKSGGERITTYLRYEKQYMEPGTKYTPEDALEIIVNGHNGSITEESAKILMKRGTKRTPDGSIYFTRDLRLKSDVIAPLTIPELKEFMSNVSCELLIIRALKGPYFMEKKDRDEFLEIYKNNCKRFVYKEVNGTHHVHLNEPEMVAPIINSFLQNMNGKL